jgi:hypothetical protein
LLGVLLCGALAPCNGPFWLPWGALCGLLFD